MLVIQAFKNEKHNPLAYVEANNTRRGIEFCFKKFKTF